MCVFVCVCVCVCGGVCVCRVCVSCRKAEEASRLLLIDHEERVKFRTGKMWDDMHLRPLFRAIHGQANTLRKMGRYREALAKYLLLEKYDSNWYTARYGNSVPRHITRTAHDSPRHRAAQSHVRQLSLPHAGRVPGPGQHRSRFALPRPVGRAGLLPQLHQYAPSHAPHTPRSLIHPRCRSTGLCWHFTRALLDFKMSARPRGCEMGEYIRFADDAGKASLIKAVQNAPAVLEYLTGRKPMPGGRLPLYLLSASSLCAAVSYVRAYGDLWRQTPGAIEWAQKNANTFFALLLFRYTPPHDTHDTHDTHYTHGME